MGCTFPHGSAFLSHPVQHVKAILVEGTRSSKILENHRLTRLVIFSRLSGVMVISNTNSAFHKYMIFESYGYKVVVVKKNQGTFTAGNKKKNTNVLTTPNLQLSARRTLEKGGRGTPTSSAS